MKHLKVFILLLIIAQNIVAQNEEYWLWAGKGDSILFALDLDNSLDKVSASNASIEYYRKAFKVQPPLPHHLYHVSCVFAILNNQDSTLKFLNDALETGFDNMEIIVRNENFNFIHHTSAWKKIVSNHEKNELEILEKNGYNTALYYLLGKIVEKDQAIRTQLRKYDLGSPELDSLHLIMQEVDYQNREELKQIIKKFGWPTISLVGKKGASNAFLIAQHSDLDVAFQKKCLKPLKKAMRNNEAEKGNYAYLKDRVLVNLGKKQLYGTQMDNKGPRPIKRRKNLDKRREKMGLEPLDVYLKSFRFEK